MTFTPLETFLIAYAVGAIVWFTNIVNAFRLGVVPNASRYIVGALIEVIVWPLPLVRGFFLPLPKFEVRPKP